MGCKNEGSAPGLIAGMSDGRRLIKPLSARPRATAVFCILLVLMSGILIDICLQALYPSASECWWSFAEARCGSRLPFLQW